MNSQPNGALFVVGSKGVNALMLYLGRVVVEMLLHIKHVFTESGQIYRLENMTNALVAQRLIDLLLCLKVDLLLLVIDPGKIRPSWFGGLYRALLPHLHVHWSSQPITR